MPRRIIDAHNHPNWVGYTVDKLVENMDQYGIAKTWLLTWEISEYEFNLCPNYHEHMDPRGLCAPLWMVIEGVRKYPDRLIPGWAPDPRDRFVRAKLKSAVALHGLKVYGELKVRMRYDNPDAIATFRYCAELGLPVLFHLECVPFMMKRQCSDLHQWPAWYGGDMSVVENMCRDCPDTIFIGHGPGFWREISADVDQAESSYPKGPIKSPGRVVELMRRYDNLYGDLSASSGATSLERDPAHGREFVLEFQDRIVFGRDGFDRRQLDVLEKLSLPDDVMDKVLYRNAVRLTGE